MEPSVSGSEPLYPFDLLCSVILSPQHSPPGSSTRALLQAEALWQGGRLCFPPGPLPPLLQEPELSRAQRQKFPERSAWQPHWLHRCTHGLPAQTSLFFFFFFNKQLQCKCTFLRRCIYSKWLPLVYSHPVLSLALGSCSTWSFGLPLWVSGGRGIIKATKAQPSPGSACQI